MHFSRGRRLIHKHPSLTDGIGFVVQVLHSKFHTKCYLRGWIRHVKRSVYSFTIIPQQRFMTLLTWWRIGRVEACGRGFETRSSCQVKTLDKSLTRSCLWHFSMKLQHSIRAVSGALLSSSGLEEAL